MQPIEVVEADFEITLDDLLSDEVKYTQSIIELSSLIFEEDINSRLSIIALQMDGEDEFNVPLAKFLVNSIIIRPLVKFGHTENLKPDFFREEINAHTINKKIDWIATELFGKVDPQEINFCIAEVLRELSDLSIRANNRIGNTVNIYSILKAADNNPELMELINLDIPGGMQFFEIEEFIDAKLKRLVEILSTEDSCLKNMILCKSAVNQKQLGQTIMNVSLKPDLLGKVIPEPINTSFLRGMRNVEDYYIDSIGARKALVTNHRQVKDSGYLARKLALLVTNTTLDTESEDCGTKHGINLHIDCHKTFDRIVGRYTMEGGLIEESDYKEALGQDLTIRSPITCRGKNGICRTCYGALSELNKNLHVGILGTLLLSSQLTQLLLSSKHLLQTRSDKIDWPEEMFDAFIVDKDQLVPTGVVDSIQIHRDEIYEDDEELCIRKFTFKVLENGSEVTRVIHLTMPLFLSEEARLVVDDNESEVYDISLNGPSPFYFSMDNNELSKPLRMILDLIDKNEHLGLTDIHDIYSRFISLLNESNITIQSNHIEIVLRELTRNPTDIIHRPNFAEKIFPAYTVLRLPDAIYNSPHLSTSLSFERIKLQLQNPVTFRKVEKGMLDGMFI
jgi:hypothetical protein